MTAAAAIVDEILTPAQELYRAEKARRIDRVRPEMVAAAAALQRLDEQIAEARKAGRPPKQLLIGKARGRAREPDPMPGRPERLTPFQPPRDTSPMETTPSVRTATQCGHPTSRRTGRLPKLCEDCEASGVEPKAPKKRAKAEKPVKRRKPVRTGFRGESPRSTRAASNHGLAGAIDHIKAEIAAVDARREQLVEALESLQKLEADAA